MTALAVIVKCAACGVILRATSTPGKVNHVSIEHENECPFLAALEAGDDAVATWVAAHGYPISYEAAS